MISLVVTLWKEVFPIQTHTYTSNQRHVDRTFLFHHINRKYNFRLVFFHFISMLTLSHLEARNQYNEEIYGKIVLLLLTFK